MHEKKIMMIDDGVEMNIGRFKIYQLFQINLEAGILDLFMEIMTCDFFQNFSGSGNWWEKIL